MSIVDTAGVDTAGAEAAGAETATLQSDAPAATGGLPQSLRDRIAHLGQHEAHPRAACIEALQQVQREFGWVSDGHLHEVARLLGMSPADLDGVATYFNLIFRRPVGRRVILLCDSVSCWLMGRDRMQAHLKQRLGIVPGQTTPDREFTLLPTVCLGHCDHAPAMMIGDTLHGDLDVAGIDRILDGERNGT